MQEHEKHQIVIVGGGAGGLELATRLGDSLGRGGKARVTLVNDTPVHVWKPLLHEVAAGTLATHENEIEYLAQAKWHHFHFRFGRMSGLDRAKKEITLEPILDEDGEEITPRRTVRYDTLVIAVGSVSNDFGIEGVSDHCIRLDTRRQADYFNREFVKAAMRAQTSKQSGNDKGPLGIVIVGAGATGVELAAELHTASRELAEYGLSAVDPDSNIRITLIDGAPRILPVLPERVSASVAAHLENLGVGIHTGEAVAKVTAEGVHTKSEKFFPGQLIVWAAGIKAPEFLKNLDGLETNRINQLVVKQNLQTTLDPDIFAMGDCCSCPQEGSERPVPPRAQAAHQMASVLAKSLKRRLQGKEALVYRYKDSGTLVSIGNYSGVGTLMGNFSKGSYQVEGKLARLMYWSLYKMHQATLNGYLRVALFTLAERINRPNRPRIKLH